MIVKPSDFLESDNRNRFRRWGKLVTRSDIDLTQANGYSLAGQWIKWNENVSLQPGRFLVVAAETGSRANHNYAYKLINNNGERIESQARIAALDVALAAGTITEDQLVKAKNSTLYSYALYISISA